MTDESTPRIEDRGPGDPEAVVVGGVHGDEPSGVRAVERLLAAAEDGTLGLQRGVRLVVANPGAVEANRRYIDADLNRVFPGDPDAEDRERRLAARLCATVGDRPTLSLHATHSTPEPMALFARDRPRALELAADLPVPYVVEESGAVEGAITHCTPAVTVEAGCQGTDAAAETAYRSAVSFLRAVGALAADAGPAGLESVAVGAGPDGAPAGEPGFYRLTGTVAKPPGRTYELLAENFRRVPAGRVWARAGDREFVADDPFYPVLMSECGYEEVFGYRADRLGETAADARGALGIDAPAD